MSALLVPLTVFMAAVFAASAIGKLASPDRGRQAFAALRLSVPYPRAAAIALIVVEALLAAGLLVTTGWFFVAFSLAGFVMTATLLAVVIRAHGLGVTDDCGCFGSWLPAAVGPRLVTRNAMLAVVALVVLVASSWMLGTGHASIGLPAIFTSQPLTASAVGALSAAVLVSAASWSIYASSNGDARLPSDPHLGSGAVVIPGNAEVRDLFAPGPRARLLVFVSPGCNACHDALERLSHAQDRLTSILDIYVLQKATSGPLSPLIAHTLPDSAHYALDLGGAVRAALNLGRGTPVAALISTDGQQAGPAALGSEEISLLISSIVSATEPTAQ